MNDNLSDLPSLYTVTGDIKDINTLLISREAVRLNAQGGSVTPQLAVSPSLLSDIRELAAYAEGSKSPRMVRASRAAWAWLEGAQPAVPDEPNWRHPKIQALIGSDARKCIQLDLIWQILEDPNQECTASDMEYWDTIHDKLKEALSTKPAPQPEISTKHGPWVESTLHEGETYCKRCLTRSIFAGDRECDPHIVEAPAAPQPAQGVPDGMVLVDRGVLNMVINALRRDAEEGRQVRGEMADLLSEARGKE